MKRQYDFSTAKRGQFHRKSVEDVTIGRRNYGHYGRGGICRASNALSCAPGVEDGHYSCRREGAVVEGYFVKLTCEEGSTIQARACALSRDQFG